MPRLFSSKVIFYLFFLLVLDVCVMPMIHFGSARPVLLYLMIPYAALEWHWQKTLAMALAVGILRDLTGSHPMGSETTVLLAASLALDLMVQKMDRESTLMRLGLTFVLVFGVAVLTLFLSNLVGISAPVSWPALWVSLGMAAATTCVMPFFFYATAWWFHDRSLFKQYELFR